MKYSHLFVSDMDYTLIMPGLEVSNKNLEAISALRNSGIAFSIATGRTHFLLGEYIDKLEIDIPVITSNGAGLWDPISRKYIFFEKFASNKVRELLELFRHYNCDISGYSDVGIYLTSGSQRDEFVENYNKKAAPHNQVPVFYLEQTELLPDFNKFLLVNAPDELLDILKTYEGLSICSSAKGFIDIMPLGINKGTGLIKLAKHLNIDMQNVYTIGDNDNDIEMIKSANVGIAMANATPLILQNADIITNKICEENGFSEGVDIILNSVCSSKP